jgi:PAS domain-containing protein
MHDIIVRKAAEKQLAQMEGRYHGLLEAAPDAMVVMNHFNAAKRWTGVKLNETLNRPSDWAWHALSMVHPGA